ncbi:DUF6882 domain-containing protein [Saccharibacillus kuerlensis]|uniref:DUF4303 domain-containing protein n=1 Tax=Saccharibacillus kuerlensis TaxID=459527 RepID=A0ABQ2L3E7_9BACL|nr:DUF6882 domain-containing protein [Saccharibacillus kuerlensis]GGO01235.1 hypothetical protein GCM10010969_23320 [Saccharibacillus kuerlensis]
MAMTKNEFENFLKKAYEELNAKQDRFIETYEVSRYSEYWIDVEKSMLDFIEEGEGEGKSDKISFEVICIGTWSPANESWMWAWAHEIFSEEVRQQAARLKELHDITGSPVFVENVFDCNEGGAMELTAMSVQHLNAIGMYRIPGDQAHLYVAVMKRNED